MLVKKSKILLHWQPYQINCEESMKKVPILLSTLTLATGGTVILGATTALANNMVVQQADERESVVPEKSENILYQQSNIFDSRIDIVVSPTKAEMTLFFDQLSDDWVRKIIVIQHNYEDGVLEEEADARMATLGVDDYSDWATKLDDWDNDLMVKNPFRPNNYDLLLEKNVSNVLKAGHPNFFYYAVQFWHHSIGDNGEDIWDDSYWIRGKVDLRSCVRSSAAGSSALTCVVDSKVNGEQYNFVLARNGNLISMPDEKIMTWSEEWQQILADRHRELIVNVKNLYKDVLTGLELSDEYDEIANKLRTILSKYPNSGDRIYELRQAQKQIKEVREFYQKLGDSGTNSEDFELLKAENETLRSKITELQLELTRVNDEKQSLSAMMEEKRLELEAAKQVITSLEQEIQDLRQQLNGADDSDGSGLDGELLDKLKKLEDQNGILKRQNDDLVEQNQRLNTKIDQIEAEYKAKIGSLETEFAEKMKNLELEKQELTAKITSLESNDKVNSCSTSGITISENASEGSSEAQIGDLNTESQSTALENQDVSNDALRAPEEGNSDSQVIDVPSLGAVETKSWIWWIILPVIAVLMVGVGVKRTLSKKH